MPYPPDEGFEDNRFLSYSWCELSGSGAGAAHGGLGRLRQEREFVREQFREYSKFEMTRRYES